MEEAKARREQRCANQQDCWLEQRLCSQSRLVLEGGFGLQIMCRTMPREPKTYTHQNQIWQQDWQTTTKTTTTQQQINSSNKGDAECKNSISHTMLSKVFHLATFLPGYLHGVFMDWSWSRVTGAIKRQHNHNWNTLRFFGVCSISGHIQDTCKQLLIL